MLLELATAGPLYRRIYDALRTKILRGELAAGAALPGTRTLARDLGVSRIVVLSAYEQLVAEADDIVIVSGAQQAIDLTARVLCDRGTRIGIEDPHYQGTRQAFAAAGARVIACAVDADGLDIERHAKRLRDARAVCVTPSH